LIKKAGLLVLDKFGNARNIRSQHQLLLRHRFHQNNGNPLAFAGNRHQIGIAVIGGEVGAGHVSGQVNVPSQPQLPDLSFQSAPLRPLAHDPAEKVESLFAERRTGSNEKVIVLYPVQTPDSEQTEWAMIGCIWGRVGGP